MWSGYLCSQDGGCTKTVRMAARKQRKQRKPRQKPTKNRPLRMVVKRGLDAAAAAYARLLVDPCNAPLTYPVYGGSDGSYLVRCESYFNAGVGASDTAHVLSWAPGCVGSSETIATNDKSLLVGSGPSSTGSMTLTALGPQSPGQSWLRNNASSYRAVAACISVIYPGSELNRSGIMGFGCVSAAVLGEKFFDNQPVTAVDTLTTLPSATKTPDGVVEINWRPSDNDSLFHNPDDSASDELTARKNAIVVAATGLPPGVGLTYKLTAVYEYKPKYGTGIVQPTRTVRSTNTLTEVLNWLNGVAGNPWVRQGAAAMAQHAMSRMQRRYPRIEL